MEGEPFCSDPKRNERLSNLVSDRFSVLEKESPYLPIQNYLTHEEVNVRRMTINAINYAINCTILGSKEQGIKSILSFNKQQGSDVLNEIREALRTFNPLKISDRHIHKLSTKQWSALCDIIKSAYLTHLKIKVNLKELNLKKWEEFCIKVVKDSHLKSLELYDSFEPYHNLSAQLLALVNALHKQTHIVNLDLSENSISSPAYDEALVRLVTQIPNLKNLNLDSSIGHNNFIAGEIIKKSLRLDNLNFSCNGLKLSSKEICIGLRESKISGVNLSHNSLTYSMLGLNRKGLERFVESIKNCELEYLVLREIDLDLIHEINGFQLLCSMIAESHLRGINLSFRMNYGILQGLFLLDQNMFKDFIESIKKSKLIWLSLFENNLNQIDANCFQLFCSMIRDASLHELSLNNNHLGQLNKDFFREFCSSVKNSKILKILLDNNEFTIDQWNWLTIELLDNFYLYSIGDIEKISTLMGSQQLRELLDRNKIIVEARNAADIALKNFRYNIIVDNAIEKLQLALSLKKDLFKEGCATDECLKNLQDLKDEVLWKNACFMRDYPLETVILSARLTIFGTRKKGEKEIENEIIQLVTNHVDLTINRLCMIPEESKYFYAAHIDAFQYYYDYLIKNGDDKISAFISALPCCFGQNNQLINFAHDFQKIFDGYLFAASNIKGGLDIISSLKANQRVTLLQFVLLQEINKGVNSNIAEKTSNKLFSKQELENKRLYRQLNKVLSNGIDINQEDSLKTIQSMWEQMQDNLLKDLKDENKHLLISTISNLFCSLKETCQLRPS